MADQKPASLVVFSDDWGRHPSSCQHLIRQLLPAYKVLWVNTIGTRAPRLNLATVRRVAEKLQQWVRPVNTDHSANIQQHQNLRVTNPRMWPWFSGRIDRMINRRLLCGQLARQIANLPQPVTAVTTLPITADLPGYLPVHRWVYYCVDDFSEWPGLDGSTLRRMDRRMIRSADEIVAVSEHLQNMIRDQNRPSTLLTHGVDTDFWASTGRSVDQSGPTVVFWGVVDRRLNVDMLTALSQQMSGGRIILYGPHQDPDPRLAELPNVFLPGPQPFDRLPEIAQAASVLVMPYADLPVTRAMQPLKMKEYLATGRPVVVSRLPAVEEWSDSLDVADSPDEFAAAVVARASGLLPSAQQSARKRLQQESWAAKARQLEQALTIPPSGMQRPSTSYMEASNGE